MLVLMHEGFDESEAARGVLMGADEHCRREGTLMAEVERLATDERDRAALADLMADMDTVTSDWPA